MEQKEKEAKKLIRI